MLPLKDLFCNYKIGLNFNIESIKIFLENINFKERSFAFVNF